MEDKNYIIKCFLNERTGKTSRTLSHAKKSSKDPYVYRVWLKDGKILDKELLYAYGESLGTIKSADEEIYNRLIKNNDNDEEGKIIEIDTILEYKDNQVYIKKMVTNEMPVTLTFNLIEALNNAIVEYYKKNKQ